LKRRPSSRGRELFEEKIHRLLQATGNNSTNATEEEVCKCPAPKNLTEYRESLNLTEQSSSSKPDRGKDRLNFSLPQNDSFNRFVPNGKVISLTNKGNPCFCDVDLLYHPEIS
jgi:hypothetical protein